MRFGGRKMDKLQEPNPPSISASLSHIEKLGNLKKTGLYHGNNDHFPPPGSVSYPSIEARVPSDENVSR